MSLFDELKRQSLAVREYNNRRTQTGTEMNKRAFSSLSGFSAELLRRRVYPVVVAYAIVAWVLLQIGEVTFGPLGLPDWVMTGARNCGDRRVPDRGRSSLDVRHRADRHTPNQVRAKRRGI